MKVDHVLILAAGKGTRMGEIGKRIPKVIWPIFEKSLLELQVRYARKLAPKAKIYINVFNYKEKILDHIEERKDSFESVEILIEEEILDIGGAIHNLAKKTSYTGNLLILNSDQFVFIERKIIEDHLSILNNFKNVLFSYEVNSNDKYNALDVEDNCLKGIIPNSKLERDCKIQTYTGMSLINLSQLNEDGGESKFFDTVVKLDGRSYVSELKDFNYWDFGTLSRYYRSMNDLLKCNDGFKEFLIEEKAIDKSILNTENGISLLNGEFKIKDKSIFYQEISEKVTEV